MNNYVLSPMTGFTFDNSKLTTEIAQVNAVMGAIYPPLRNGTFPNPRQKVEEANAQLKKIGLEKIREELTKQLQAFFAAKK
ncbi:hypothetical protein D3C76_1193610 [compost metagenome]